MSWEANKQTNKGEVMSEYVAKETVEQVLEYPFADLSSRGIRKEIAIKLGIRMSVSQEDGRTPTAHYFPYYNQQDKVVAFKKRDLTKAKEEKFHFTAVGKLTVDCKFFGQSYADAHKRRKSNLILTEGEYDCAAYLQAAIDSVANTQHQGLEPFVVSIGLGTANAVDNCLHNKGFIDRFDKLTLLFDNDKATAAEKRKGVMKGQDATIAVATSLMKDNIYTTNIPEDYKDPNDMLLAGKGRELVAIGAFDAVKFVGEKIVEARSVTFDELLEARREGVYVNTFPKLMDKIHGFRGSELVVLCAPSNVGKSFVCAEFAYSFINNGEPVGFMMLEETNKETLQRVISRKLEVNYNVFKDKPMSVATKEQIQDAYSWATEEKNIYMLDHFGSIPIDELMNKIRTFVFIHKCRFIILDHLSIVISGSKVADERKELDTVMTELATFCAANDVCIIAVSHINRSNASDFKPPKGKENEPFWVGVTKESMRGSSSLEQLSWIVLGLEPQILPDKSRGNVRLTVLKNRPFGYLGVADEFNMDQTTGLLKTVVSDGF